MTFPIEAVRAQFKALSQPGARVYFDAPGGTQACAPAIAAMVAHLESGTANSGGAFRTSIETDAVSDAAHAAMADLLGGGPHEIAFGPNMTSLTLAVSRALSATWTEGDEIVLTRLDHDANVAPWMLAARDRGVTVRWLDFDPGSGELALDQLAGQLGSRTRLVALTGASNLLGTRPDLAAVGEQAHRAGALFYVDGVHLSAHAGIDVAALAADFYACSPYKFFGPHCGVVAADPGLLGELRPDKLLPATDDVPERFELGTLAYELLAGTTAAVYFIAGLAELPGPPAAVSRRERVLASMQAVEQHEDALRVHLEAELGGLAGVRVHSRARRRTPTLLLTFAERPAAEAYRYLAARKINAPAGTFYAYEPARRLGLPDGGLRIGLAPYNNDADVERLLDGLAGFLAG